MFTKVASSSKWAALVGLLGGLAFLVSGCPLGAGVGEVETVTFQNLNILGNLTVGGLTGLGIVRPSSACISWAISGSIAI